MAPRLEGALAPVPRPLTPPPRDREEPLRDIPGLRKRERTWRDEVRERVRSRRQKKAEAGLPLFDQPEVGGPSPLPSGTPAEDAPPTAESLHQTESAERMAPPDVAPVPRDQAAGPQGRPDAIAELVATPLSEEELADLPLRPSEPLIPVRAAAAEIPGAEPVEARALEEGFELTGEQTEDEGISLRPPPLAPEPLERPARPGERAQAAALDAGLLTVLGALVLYFTGRAARVDVLALAPSWPWLLSYLAFLGLFYAGYFTGTTGQTPGKMITGLRVVDPAGRPPGYARAVVRAAAGALGTVVAGLGLVTMAFDPARRALHDRLLQTRVVHR